MLRSAISIIMIILTTTAVGSDWNVTVSSSEKEKCDAISISNIDGLGFARVDIAFYDNAPPIVKNLKVYLNEGEYRDYKKTVMNKDAERFYVDQFNENPNDTDLVNQMKKGQRLFLHYKETLSIPLKEFSWAAQYCEKYVKGKQSS